MMLLIVNAWRLFCLPSIKDGQVNSAVMSSPDQLLKSYGFENIQNVCSLRYINFWHLISFLILLLKF